VRKLADWPQMSGIFRSRRPMHTYAEVSAVFLKCGNDRQRRHWLAGIKIRYRDRILLVAQPV
jgi:hypothetical protein